jgi:hypothetical protein
MGEDEYDALPEEEKQRIDQKRLQRKKDRLLKYEDKSIFSLIISHFREQRIKEEKARLEQERLLAKEAEAQ